MDFFKEKITAVYGSGIAEQIINGSKNRKTTLRVNTLKTTTENVIDSLSSLGIQFIVAPFSNTSFIIHDGFDKLRDSTLYQNGEIYLQSLSSQLPPIVLSPKEKEDILDMTAAPGGKTTQIASLTNNKCRITACEMNRKRAERLKFNIEKQGVTCANVMVTDARRLESFFAFDKILLDAPCSGSGTLNLANPKSYSGFTQILINKCVSAQTALLEKALSVLKAGGEMVYSTCSVLPEENEEIVKKVTSKFNCEILPIDENIKKHLPLLPCSLDNALCVAPTEEYEGFFVVKIKKTGK
jgi:NOL1/NOP2/sun family putative RNA methylase